MIFLILLHHLCDIFAKKKKRKESIWFVMVALFGKGGIITVFSWVSRHSKETDNSISSQKFIMIHLEYSLIHFSCLGFSEYMAQHKYSEKFTINRNSHCLAFALHHHSNPCLESNFLVLEAPGLNIRSSCCFKCKAAVLKPGNSHLIHWLKLTYSTGSKDIMIFSPSP